jgi:hypothetical protein
MLFPMFDGSFTVALNDSGLNSNTSVVFDCMCIYMYVCVSKEEEEEEGGGG